MLHYLLFRFSMLVQYLHWMHRTCSNSDVDCFQFSICNHYEMHVAHTPQFVCIISHERFLSFSVRFILYLHLIGFVSVCFFLIFFLHFAKRKTVNVFICRCHYYYEWLPLDGVRKNQSKLTVFFIQIATFVWFNTECLQSIVFVDVIVVGLWNVMWMINVITWR